MAVELGLGLIAIAREWGTTKAIPTVGQANSLLSFAYDSGVRFFDTAPAYGKSEIILGDWMGNFSQSLNVSVSTKMGEFWDEHASKTFVSHEYKNLKNSIDMSLQRLGKIDILSVHKANSQNIGCADVLEAISYAKTKGVNKFGVSVSDLQTAEEVALMDQYTYIQFPLNLENKSLTTILRICESKGKIPVVNRPLNMGKIAVAESGRLARITSAFDYLVGEMSNGYILSGTSDLKHFVENLGCFNTAKKNTLM